jgi:hypothetical protein
LQFVTCLLGASAPFIGRADTGSAQPATAGAAQPAATTAASTATATTAGTASGSAAKDEEPEKEKFPIGASFSLGYRADGGNFASTESDDANFGSQSGTLGASVGYDITDDISVGLDVGVLKEFSESYNRPGGVSNRLKRDTVFQDVGVGVNWGNFYTIPVLDISLSAGLGGQLPTSKSSRAADLILGLSANLDAAWHKGNFNTGLSLSASHSFNEHPTLQYDCAHHLQHQCEVAGKDLGEPLGLNDLSAGLHVGYKFFGKLGVSLAYTISNSYGAVEFPNDQYTVSFAQTGAQEGTGSHSGTVGLSYQLFEKTSLSARMSTGHGIYSNDNKRITFPFWDFESDLHNHTSYSLSISQSL